MRIPIPFSGKELYIEKRDGNLYIGLRAKRQSEEINVAGNLSTGGRSSVPSGGGIGDILAGFGTLKPIVPFELLPIISLLCQSNPDFSETTVNFVTQANTGHDLLLDADSDALIDKAVEDLNATAERLWSGSGVDGLVNQLLRQVIVTGALSAEIVTDSGLQRVESAVLVPTSTIRFKRDELGEPIPYQKVSMFTQASAEGLIPLNPLTYRYLPLYTEEDNPYGIPPFLAALEPTTIQLIINKNIKFIAKKMGILGFIDVTVTLPPKNPNESQDAYTNRCNEHIRKVAESITEENYSDGIFVHGPEIQTRLDHIGQSGGQGSSSEIGIISHIEQLICSGLGIDPAMLGRSYSTTETYAGIVYRKMTIQAQHMRQLVKVFLEHTYMLEAILQGFGDVGIEVQFEENAPFDLNKAAQFKETEVRAALMKVTSGMCDPDMIAAELGYESWYDLSLIIGAPQTINDSQGDANLIREWARRLVEVVERHKQQDKMIKLRRDERRGRYVFRHPRILLEKKSTARDKKREILEQQIVGYLARLQPLNDEWRRAAESAVISFLELHDTGDFMDADEFASALMKELEATHRLIFDSEKLREEIEDKIEEIYGYFRLKDFTPFAGFEPDLKMLQKDTDLAKFLRNIDAFYFSKYIDNSDMRDSVLKFFREEYLERGSGLFGKGTKDLERFRALFADRLESLADWQVRRIVTSSVQRISNWANFRSMDQAGIELSRWVEVMDANTCDICKPLHNTIISVKTAIQKIDEAMVMSEEDYASHLKSISLDKGWVEKTVAAIGAQETMNGVVNDGMVGGLHPGCRGNVVSETIISAEKGLCLIKAA